MVIVNKTEFCKHLHYKMTQICIASGTNVSRDKRMYLNCTNMYPLGFNRLVECRLLNILKLVLVQSGESG